jgi:hypothetical protein
MWASILGNVLVLAGKFLDSALVNKLMAHVNAIAKLETRLNEEYAKPLDQQDDLLIPYLEGQLSVELAAFDRQLAIGVKAIQK